MATRTRKAEASLLGDRIDILNRDAVEVSAAKQIFRTVSTTLALVRVGAHSASACGFSPITEPGQADRRQRFRAAVRVLFQCMRCAEDRDPGEGNGQSRRIRGGGTRRLGKVG